MIFIAGQLRAAINRLFPTRKHRIVLLGLVMVAAAIAVSELAVAKIFIEIVLQEQQFSRAQLIIITIAFFIFFGVTRAGHYLQKIYRLDVFEKTLKIANKESFKGLRKGSKYKKEHWTWSLAIELTNILSLGMRLVVVSFLFVFFSPVFVVINLIVTLIIFEKLSRIYRKQLIAQRKFVVASEKKEPISNAHKVKTRVRSGEVATLYSNLGMMALLAVLLYLGYRGEIEPANAIVLFLGLRLQNGSLSAISVALMRFARAQANIE